MNNPDISGSQNNTIATNQAHTYRNRKIILLPSSTSESLDQTMPVELQKHIKDSISFNTVLASISLIKVVASASIMISVTGVYSNALMNFIKYTILNDAFYTTSLILKIVTILKSTFTFAPEPQSQMNNHNSNNDQGIAAERQPDSVRSPFKLGDSVFAISKEAENTISTKMMYYILFFYGQFLYFYSPSDCSETDPTVQNLVFFHIICGYLYIGLPVIFVIGMCLYLPCIMVWMCLFSSGDQSPVNMSFIKKLPIISYSKPLPGNNECSICILEYQKDDKIIQLKCSPMHHFHESCLKKWLKINGLCPVCRHRIDEPCKPTNNLNSQTNNLPQ